MNEAVDDIKQDEMNEAVDDIKQDEADQQILAVVNQAVDSVNDVEMNQAVNQAVDDIEQDKVDAQKEFEQMVQEQQKQIDEADRALLLNCRYFSEKKQILMDEIGLLFDDVLDDKNHEKVLCILLTFTRVDKMYGGRMTSTLLPKSDLWSAIVEQSMKGHSCLTPEHIVGGVFREPCAPNPQKKLGECHDHAVIIITMGDCQGIRPWALCRRIEQATGMLGYPHDFECTVSIFN